MTAALPEDDRIVWGIGSAVAVVADERGGEGRVHLLALDQPAQQVPVVLTGTGLYLWTVLEQGPCSVAGLVDSAVVDFPALRAEAIHADVVGFVAGLHERGILVPHREPGPAS